MKYWNCVKVPVPSWAQVAEPVSNVDETENTETNTSVEESQVLVTENVDPATVEEVKDQIEKEHQNTPVDSPAFSPEFHTMFNNAFGIPNNVSTVPVNAVEISADEANIEPPFLAGVDLAQNPDVSIEPVAGTDGYSVSVKVPDNPSGLIINESPVPITEPNGYVSPDEAESVVEETKTKPTFSKDSLLSAIQNSAPVTTPKETTTGPIEQTHVPEKKEEYALSDDNFKAAVKALTDWIKEFFPDMKLRLPISKKFIANIPKDVIDAHFDAVAKYELHPIMSPLFYYIPSLAEDPFMEIGEFINFVVTEATDNDNAIDIIESMDKRKEYYEKFADDEESEADDEVEDDPDCPPDESEEETKD